MASDSIQQREPNREPLLTAEEFYERFAGKDFELVRGKVVPMAPTSPEHGDTDSNLHLKLGAHVKERQLGKVYLNTGFILFRNPDVIRGPDQAFVSRARIDQHPPPESGFWPLAPDLVVEVVSPNDTAEDVALKVSEYLAAGVRMVWVVYPRQHQVHQFRPGSDPRILTGEALLDGDDVVPAFRIKLDEIWSS